MDAIITLCYLTSAASCGIACALAWRNAQSRRAELAYERHVAKLEQRNQLERIGLVRAGERQFGRNV